MPANMQYRPGGGALLRATYASRIAPPLPDPAGTGRDPVAAWKQWLRGVWALDPTRDAIAHASPSLDRQVRALIAAPNPGAKALRSAVRSVDRYLRRSTDRCTPSGLFGGVAAVSFGDKARVVWGDRNSAVAHADAGWLDALIRRLEADDAVLRQLVVNVDNTVFIRGPHAVVPYVSAAEAVAHAREVTIRLTTPLRLVLELACHPVAFDDLANRLAAAFPSRSREQVDGLLKTLIAHRVLVTELRAPATEPEAFGHVVGVLQRAVTSQGSLLNELHEIHALLARHGDALLDRSGGLRIEAARRMRAVADTVRHPVAVDVRVDVDVALPTAVAEEAARAAELLARLSPLPYGAPAWGDYHRRFYGRYGPGTLVPLLDVVSDRGLGWPEGFPGTTTPAARPRMSHRDDLLIRIAQQAVQGGAREVVLDDGLLADLGSQSDARAVPPPHIEIVARIEAVDTDALDRGDFRLVVRSVSRAAGVVCGRFLDVLGPSRSAELLDGMAKLPGGDPATVVAHLSFPPLDVSTAHVARSRRVMSHVVSLGEVRGRDELTLGAADLAVGCDSRRLYLAVPRLGRRIEAWATHALSLRLHTPPLARFVTEVSRATCTQVTDFDWGAASSCAFLPRIRVGRVVLAAARWHIRSSELAPKEADFDTWQRSFTRWAAMFSLPDQVVLRDGDRPVTLTTSCTGDLLMLRDFLRKHPSAVLEEAPADKAAGWCSGRAHEVVVPVKAAQPYAWPTLPDPDLARVVSADHSAVPGSAQVLEVRVYGDPRRQDVILGEYLPALLDDWPGEERGRPSWWFLRCDDGGGRSHHLRLRLGVADSETTGLGVSRVGAWASVLHREGLVSEMSVTTVHPQTGRWGDGPAYSAATGVLTADSDAVLAQLCEGRRDDKRALAAAHLFALAAAFTGDVAAGARWLVGSIATPPSEPVPRSLLDHARRLANPVDGFASILGDRKDERLVAAWTERDHAAQAYREFFPGTHTRGIAADAVLDALMHAHVLRVCGTSKRDKAVCLQLARSAALAWQARRGQDGRP